MSIVTCEECGKTVDTDFTLECWCEDIIIKEDVRKS